MFHEQLQRQYSIEFQVEDDFTGMCKWQVLARRQTINLGRSTENCSSPKVDEEIANVFAFC